METLAQRLARQQLGDRVGDAVVGTEIVDGEDVRVIELGDGLGLALETREPIGVGGHRLRQHLDRHIAIEPLVVRAVDHAHPALADLLDDAVVAEGGADHFVPPAGCTPGISTPISNCSHSGLI